MFLHVEQTHQIAPQMGWMGYSLLFFVVLLSGLCFLFIKEIKAATLKLMLSFTGAFLFALCVMHMIPEVYEADHHIGLYILIGFFSQLVLEFWSEGIEHGHIHVHSHGDKKFPLTMMIGLCIHSFLEAMPLANGHHDSDHLLFAIVLHHIPIAIALMSMLMASHINRMQAVLYLMIFAAMPPLGALVSSFINQSDIWAVANFAPKIKAVVIGIFLHVSTTILFETDHDHRFNLKKLVIVILGASLAFIHF